MAILVLAVAFLVELAGFAAFGVAAARVLGGPLAGVVAAFAGACAVWSVVVAPRARNPLTQPQRDGIGTAILLLAGAALAFVGLDPGRRPSLSIVVIVDGVALAGPRPRRSRRLRHLSRSRLTARAIGAPHATRTRPAPARQRPRQQLSRRGRRRHHHHRRRYARPIRRPGARARGDGPHQGRRPRDRAHARGHRPRRLRRVAFTRRPASRSTSTPRMRRGRAARSRSRVPAGVR